MIHFLKVTYDDGETEMLEEAFDEQKANHIIDFTKTSKNGALIKRVESTVGTKES